MAYFDNSYRMGQSHYHNMPQEKFNHSYSMYNSTSLRPFSSFVQPQNQYYPVKPLDDYRFDRAMLQKPAFLIKDEFMYSNDNFVSQKLDYADRLIQDTKSKRYYRQDAQQYRTRKIGQNPFNKNILQIGQNIKKRVNSNAQSRNQTLNPNKSDSHDLASDILKFRTNLNTQSSKPIARSVFVLGLKPKQEQKKAQMQIQKQSRQRQSRYDTNPNLSKVTKSQKQKNKYSQLTDQYEFDNPFQRQNQDDDSDFASKKKQHQHIQKIPEQSYEDYFGQKYAANTLQYSNQKLKHDRKNIGNSIYDRSDYTQTKGDIALHHEKDFPEQIGWKGKIFKRII